MFIKEVSISGFRSYRERTVVKDFSRGHNVVVGRNGSGKSNFFFAIQFVLSDDYAHLNKAARMGLIHEGNGPRISTARVEIVFDNTDRRIVSFDKDEVKVVRQVGNKTDQYYIDDKVVKKAEVSNLMEAAGFSGSNSYYIVKQGKINELATAPDERRLKLLREVAGTRIYDEKKKESEEILREAEGKCADIKETLRKIVERLEELTKEKEDLQKYQAVDRRKRAVEYTIHDAELAHCMTRIEDIAKQRQEMSKRHNEFGNKLTTAQEKVVEVEGSIAELERKRRRIKEEEEELMEKRRILFQKKAELETMIAELKDNIAADEKERENGSQRKKKLNKEYTRAVGELERRTAFVKELFEKEERLKSDLKIAKDRSEMLLAKQGDRTRFKSAADRNAYYAAEVKRIASRLDEVKEGVRAMEREMKADGEKKQRLEEELTEADSLLKKCGLEAQKSNEGLFEKQKEIEREIGCIQTEELLLKRAQDAEYEASRRLEEVQQRQLKFSSRVNVMGMRNLQKLLVELEATKPQVVEKFRGFVIDVIECEEDYYTAVQVAGGNRLYNAIVDDDRTAMELLKEFNTRKMDGQLNFLPLNRMQKANIPTVNDDDAKHILSILQYDQSLRAAVEFTFAKYAIVRTIEVGQRISKECRVDCVTLEGDEIKCRGPMSGGYRSQHACKLTMRDEERKARKLQVDSGALVVQKTREIEERRQNVQKLKGELRELEEATYAIRLKHEEAREAKERLRRECREGEKEAEMKTNELTRKRERRRQLEQELEFAQKELKRSLNSQLNTQEEDEIDALMNEIRDRKRELDRVEKERGEEERARDEEERGVVRLTMEGDEMDRMLDNVDVMEWKTAITARQEELMEVGKAVGEVEKRQRELENEENALDFPAKMEKLQEKLASAQAKVRSCEEDDKRMRATAEGLLLKEREHKERMERASEEISKIGTVPSEAFSRYKGCSRAKLLNMLSECVAELQKFDAVNQKALDQFTNATTKKEELERRLKVQETNAKSLVDLIDILESRKYDAIRLTFKQVTKNFSDIFAELVPGGEATLVWKASTDASQETPSQSDMDGQTKDTLDSFIGIGMRVSFGGGSASKEIRQLSGGQKSLVALALIFAIQKCDPAPIYLFDEVDAALDPQHRKAVADMIHKMSEHAQFITTTFRKELLEHAEQCYGVIFRTNVSHIEQIDKSKALDFVEDDVVRG